MSNNWQKIWESRKDTLYGIDMTNYREVFVALKRINGFDVNGFPSVDSLLQQYENTKKSFNLAQGGKIFEVGCGAGANLYLFARDGFEVGGLDYSATLIDIARKVIPAENLSELVCAGADELPTDKKFDAVFSSGVFAYFDDFAYAERVLEKMLLKSRRSIAVLAVYDKDFEEAHMNHRRRIIKNYDERYKDLPKLFYPRKFFEDFAARHDLSIRFAKNELEGYYGNPEFIYHCFMERKGSSCRQ